MLERLYNFATANNVKHKIVSKLSYHKFNCIFIVAEKTDNF
jgi:hypothetical protein